MFPNRFVLLHLYQSEVWTIMFVFTFTEPISLTGQHVDKGVVTFDVSPFSQPHRHQRSSRTYSRKRLLDSWHFKKAVFIMCIFMYLALICTCHACWIDERMVLVDFPLCDIDFFFLNIRLHQILVASRSLISQLNFFKGKYEWFFFLFTNSKYLKCEST